MTPRAVAESLFGLLAGSLGRHSAAQELKWMQDHASSVPALHGMVRRRLKGEPLQYILGTQPFGPLDVKVRPPVLIPRPETEDWTLRLARRLSPSRKAPLKLLDLCTGTGCIPLLLCHTWPSGSIHALGTDIAIEAVELAKENADHIQSQLNQNFISFLQADMLKDGFSATLEELGWSHVDVLTSNPPYIPLYEYSALSSSVKDYEDPRALLGDPVPNTSPDGRGLTFYRRIAQLVGNGLVKPGGLIALEVGHDQSAEVEHLMQSHGHVRSTEVWKDPWGVQRTVVCTK